ncbi:MAG: hypothetical protein WCX64_02960 [Candidatus Micrarchaeia archaeon]
MDSSPRVNPVFLLYLRKTLSKCGETQGESNRRLSIGDTIFNEGSAEMPVDLKENRKTIEAFRTLHKMPNASDAEVLCKVANLRVENCKNEKGNPISLKQRAKDHEIGAYLHESGAVHIRITRK